MIVQLPPGHLVRKLVAAVQAVTDKDIDRSDSGQGVLLGLDEKITDLVRVEGHWMMYRNMSMPDIQIIHRKTLC